MCIGCAQIVGPDGEEHALHLMPSGVLNEHAACLVGNGIVVHLPTLLSELDELESAGIACSNRLFVSDRAHLLSGVHMLADGLREDERQGGSIGTTRRGIGPAYASKALREGVRVGDLRSPDKLARALRALDEENRRRFGSNWSFDVESEIEDHLELAKRMQHMIVDSVDMLHTRLQEGQSVLVEGANAALLDIDFGTYPFVTSSNPSMGGLCAGTGIPPNAFSSIVGVCKAYTTRVGAGPFPTEAIGSEEEELRERGGEFGTTTGRPRRCGWLDGVALKHACRINGFSSLNLTKLDVLSGLDEVPIATAYRLPSGDEVSSFPADLEDLEQVEPVYERLPGWSAESMNNARGFEELPERAQQFVSRVEQIVGVECKYIGVGPGREALIEKKQQPSGGVLNNNGTPAAAAAAAAATRP
jgi:adenylosuccinate synthase